MSDALARLKQEGVVTELPDGTLDTLPPHEAALHIDKLWDACLDNLPDITTSGEGQEIERRSAGFGIAGLLEPSLAVAVAEQKPSDTGAALPRPRHGRCGDVGAAH